MKRLAHTHEADFIRRLASRLSGDGDRRLLVGIGDDTAVWKCPGRDLVLTSDAVIEGAHFLPGAEPARIGHKAVGRVLSDCAAMGAVPEALLINLIADPSHPPSWWEEVYRGANDLVTRFGAVIAGGDVSKGTPSALHVFALGTLAANPVTRAGAKAGDWLYVTGSLGGSILGRHLDFEPRIPEGRWLAEQGWATSMIDLSDGLATDLRHVLAQSGVGAILDAEAIPVSAAARSMNDGKSPLQHAITDGEDYELLFTIPDARAEAFEKAWAGEGLVTTTRIGTLTRDPDRIELREKDRTTHLMDWVGFDHLGV